MQLKDITFAQVEAIAQRNKVSRQRKAKPTEPIPTGWKPQRTYEQFVAKESRKQYGKNRKQN